MKKVITLEEIPKQNQLYTEEYVVKYKIVEDGITKYLETSYFTMNKNSHKAVGGKFKEQHKNTVLLSIEYQ